ncbi:MAG: sialate O-acetylesterase [Phycisphaerae bacterium]|nr:sialate O-acetylesterase [Tepidisphaeraceae bacterium]
MTRTISRAGAIGLSMFWALAAQAEVKLPPVFSDHAVLQRGMAVPVWGTAAAGEKVTVKFRGQEKTATAGPDGAWRIKLDALEAGGPDELTVAGTNTLTLKDVLVGDVWLGSGQSNMGGSGKGYSAKDPVLAKNIAAGPYPKLRLITPKSGWKEATPANLEGFSAIHFSFGLPLQKETNVPIGLLYGAVGGTPSGDWLTAAMFDADAGVKAVVAKGMESYKPDEEKARYEKAKAAYEKQLAELPKAEPGKPAPKKPNAPTAYGPPGTMNNGGKPGRLFEQHLRGYVGYAMKGVLWDQGESGTAVRGVDQYTLMGALIRGWRNEWGQGDFAFIYVQKPSGGGPAWDPASPVTDQASKFVPMPMTGPAKEVNTANGGASRELHTRIVAYPNTFMATSSDLGAGIHPTNKSGYGARAARVALGAVYGQKVEYYGPVFDKLTVEGDAARATFSHTGQGLATPAGQPLQGFAIAGEDKQFYWATATIDGDAVVLKAKEVTKPVAVRYAWAATFPWANLFNKDGLPAQAFRTDAW